MTRGEREAGRTFEETYTRRRFLELTARRSASAAVLLGSSGALLAACGDSPEPPAPTDDETAAPAPETGDAAPAGIEAGEPFAFGRMLPMTGDLVAAFAPFYATIDIAVEEINAAGGVLGHELAFDSYDDQASPAESTVAARRAASDGMPLVLGPVGSSSSLAAMAALNPESVLNVPYALDAAVGQPQRYPYTFQFGFHTGDQGTVMMRYFLERGAERIGYLIEQGAFADGLAAGAGPALSEQGLAPAARPAFAPGAPDVRPSVETLAEEGVDAVGMFIGGPTNFARVLAAMNELSYFPMIITTGGLWTVPNLELLAEDMFDKAFVATNTTVTYSADRPIGDRQRELAEKIVAHEQGRIGPHGAMISPFYDSLYAFKETVESANSFEVEAVKAELESGRTFDGTLGAHTFSADNHTGLGLDELSVGLVSSLLDDEASVQKIFYEEAPSA